jgi:hypothetical protein
MSSRWARRHPGGFPLAQGPSALLGHLLVSHRSGPCHQRVSAGTGPPAVGRLRRVGAAHRRSALPAEADVAGSLRKHVPDYLLLTNIGPLVVDSEPLARLARPLTASRDPWTHDTITTSTFLDETLVPSRLRRPIRDREGGRAIGWCGTNDYEVSLISGQMSTCHCQYFHAGNRLLRG